MRLALALALVAGGGAVALNLDAFFPNWAVVFQWTGEGRNPAAFALSVGKGHNRVGQRDWNDVGFRGRYAKSGTAKPGDVIVASGLPTDSRAYMTCLLTINNRVADRDPNDGGEPTRGNGALCKGVMP
jgi:hypothetical protein